MLNSFNLNGNDVKTMIVDNIRVHIYMTDNQNKLLYYLYPYTYLYIEHTMT